MRTHWMFGAVSLVLLATAVTLRAQSTSQPRIVTFSPQGTVKNVRQVRVRFSDPMVPFGDPRSIVNPFDVECGEKGTGRWADARNWVFDFDQDLGAGVRCEFRVRTGLKTLAGTEIGGQRRFTLSTGGPGILSSIPEEGSNSVSEDQIFILQLDGNATSASVLSNVFFTVEGISERVGVRIVEGSERQDILKAEFPYKEGFPKFPILIQSKQKLPAGARVSLIWGKGIVAPTGVGTDQDQVLSYAVQTPFSATFECQRENAQAQCVPVSPMRVLFSAPVQRALALKALLKGPNGRHWSPESTSSDYEEDETSVRRLVFKGPFPEKSDFTIEIPLGLKDDSGRDLTNANSFPLAVRTDEYPPLAKFSAAFGILESKGTPLLPVTLRNVEPEVEARILEVTGGEDTFDVPKALEEGQNISGGMRGRIFRVPSDKTSQMVAWIKKVEQRSYEDREKSIFGVTTSARAQNFKIPKPKGGRPFEVVGIPMRSPGFYVVEIESEILGSALLGQPKPMFVPTTVLVTNLSVHFEWGIESSLIWVTTLDEAKPVAEAAVQVMDCEGKVRWQGKTDRNGIAGIHTTKDSLSLVAAQSPCFYDRGLVVSAQSNGDMAFVQTNWNEGIEPWRFRLPTEYRSTLVAAHTILDRTLLRAGETVHMKHILRKHLTSGLARVPQNELPGTLLIKHLGSDQKYEIPLRWDANGAAETNWTIPKEAKLGDYFMSLTLTKDNVQETENCGSFRVEEFRVPLMKAVIRPPAGPLVAPSSLPVDLTVAYLQGGGAGKLPVKFRYEIHPRYLDHFADFEGFSFAGAKVREGIVRSVPGEDDGDQKQSYQLKSIDLALDNSGSVRATITGLPKPEAPMELQGELEFKDPSGEVQTVSSTVPLWPASRLIGLRPDSWSLSKENLKFQVAVVDLNGKPVADAPVKVDLYQQKTYSHRKRLVGGFYAYEHLTETKRLQPVCEGKTDKRGLLFCNKPSSVSGNLVLQAATRDDTGREAVTTAEVWVAGEDEWWFQAGEGDRIDVIPERGRYEPGQTAKLQVRMPFRKATALITIQREGVGESFVKEISGKEPVIEIPIKGNYAPNVFVSVLAVRGRVGGVQPAATVDLGRPAYKLGIAEIRVGWAAHELKVRVASDRSVYKVREKARVTVTVTFADGKVPPAGSEIALAAVDEGLLELQPNSSWNLLEAMMGRRRYGVQTSTAQTHVIGKRHFGLKALPQGGGGGKQITRELFDTLLFWKARVPLDEKGTASVDVPLNDSLTGFRIVAVANGGEERFGTGSTSIRSTQDLMMLSGIAPVVRQGDQYRSEFTLRNATEHVTEVLVSGGIKETGQALSSPPISLAPGESKEIGWNVTAPTGVDTLTYELEAKSGGGSSDRLKVVQKVVAAIPVRAFQATLTQIDGTARVQVAQPKDALPERGGIEVSLRPSLLEGMSGVTGYMSHYPYTCLEQLVSQAVVLQNPTLWNRVVARLPSYLDSDGLAKYFPSMRHGSDVLTSYILAIANESGWQIPSAVAQRMTAGLLGFVEGRVIRSSALPTPDVPIRKLAALEALSRWTKFEPSLLSSISIDPNLWPTSAVIDWSNILRRVPNIRNRDDRIREAEQILRSRLNFHGTTMGFSTEATDYLWWLMTSVDSNSVRLISSEMDSTAWEQDMPNLARGALGRQRFGHWDTTVANAWGVLAMNKFSKKFEKTPVSGKTSATIEGKTQTVDWTESPKGKPLSFAWPRGTSTLDISAAGTGKPWATVQSLAAIPLKAPLSTGFRIKKTLLPVEQKEAGVWNRGDIVRVRLEVDAQADMTWVVVDDPIPAGASILGTGLGRDSALATRGEQRTGWVWPDFEERSQEAFRSYYEFVPKGSWTIEYTVRLNNAGLMNLPTTRVEAMYSPEMLGEIPNPPFRIK